MIRHWVILAAAAITATAYDNRAKARDLTADAGEARNVILVVSDGLR